MKSNDFNSVYMKIYYRIVEDIINGRYGVGDIIPTQNEMAAEFGASRVTVREAIKMLIHRGVLKAVKGKGTYVIAKPQAVGGYDRTAGFSQSLRNYGNKVKSKIINIETIPADRRLSACLRVPIHTLLVHIYRIRYIGEMPMCLDDVYIVKRYSKGVDFFREDLENGSLYLSLKKAGIILENIEEKFRAVSCPEDVADYLGIGPGEPILQIQRLSFDEFGKALEYCENYERTDINYAVVKSKRSDKSEISPQRYLKILGCLFGSAIGDAMGAITRTYCTDLIKLRFGGYVNKLAADPSECSEQQSHAGSVTGDFSQAYFTAFEMAKAKGSINEDTAANALITWAEYPEFFQQASQTTQMGVRRLMGERITLKNEFLPCQNLMATNGSSVRCFPAGLINPGNIEKAVSDAAELCLPTHPFDATISAGAAVAAAVSAAMADGSALDDVLQAGIRGASEGFAIGKEKGRRLAVPSVEKRIRLAIEIAKNGTDWEDIMIELEGIIGSGNYAHEAVPCAFGILAANGNDPMAGIKMAVNIGGETSTVAAIVGAISGALYGADTLPAEYLELINTANGFDIEWIAHEIAIRYYE